MAKTKKIIIPKFIRKTFFQLYPAVFLPRFNDENTIKTWQTIDR